MSYRNVVSMFCLLLLGILGFWLGIVIRLRRMSESLVSRNTMLVAQFIDVGDGDSALISSPDGITILIDAGPDNSGAREIVAQQMRLRGVMPQAVILTSARTRSIGGLAYVLDHMSVHCPIVLPCSTTRFLAEGGDSAAADIAAAQRRHLHVLSWRQFEASPLQAALGNSTAPMTLIPIGASRTALGRGSSDANALAVRVDYGASSVMYAAGLNPHEEDEMIAQRVNLPCTVLAATDSAQSGSLSSEFLALTGPQTVVISTGADQPPDEQVLARLGAADAIVRRTDLSGPVALGLSSEPATDPVPFGAGAPLPAGADSGMPMPRS